jgi:type IV pilus assembly protein PilV
MKSPFERAKKCPGRQSGSYLLEALVAILIFAFGVLGLIGLFGSSIRVTNDARYRSEAGNLASAMIADMWTMTASQIDTQFATGGTELNNWTAKAASLLPGTAANPPTVDVQPGFSAESRTVEVKIYWQLPGESDKHQYMMSAQIGKNP